MIIGVTGKAGAGKTTFVRYLGSKGFEHLSLSDLIRNELALRNMEVTRQNLQDVGNEMRKTCGLDFWAKKALEIMDPGRNYVVDSIRNPGEVKALAGSGNFILFSVDAPLKTRFARISLRPGRDEKEPLAFADFQKSESREIASALNYNQQLDACSDMADAVIANDSDMASFFAKIDAVLVNYQKLGRNSKA